MKGVFILRSSLPVLFLLLTASLYADPTLDKLMADKKYKEAIDYADDKISGAQRDAGVWEQLGQANEAINIPEKALACYLVAWRLNQSSYTAMLGSARVYNALGQPDMAVNMAKKALDKNFTAEASWEYAKACIALNRSVEAKAALEKVIQGDAGNEIAARELGNIYFNEKAWSNAIPLLRKTYTKSPNALLAYKLGKSYGETGNADSAVYYLKLAVGQQGAPDDAGLILARALFGQGNYPEASAAYSKLSGAGLLASDHYNAAVAAEKSGNAAAALMAYEKAVSVYGADKSQEALLAREKVARAQMNKKAWPAALVQLEFIAAADPKGAVVPEIYFLLADSYLGMNAPAKAISSLEKLIALNGKNIEARARLADLYQKAGNTEKAKQTLESIIELSPNDPDVYLSLGQYNLKAKKFAEAFSQFEKSNTIRKSAPAASGMASAAFNMNRANMALEAARSATAMDPKLPEPHLILAQILYQSKNYPEAQPQLEFLVQYDSSKIEYLQQLADCYMQNGEKAKLLDLDKRIVAHSSTDVPSRLRLAKEADNQRRIDAALPLYKEVAALQPQNADVLRRLYEIYLGKKSNAEAAAALGKALAARPTAEWERDYGDVLYTLKDYDKALVAYRTAVKLNPAIKGFYKRYAEIVIAKGQQDEVITALSNVIRSGEADVGTYQTLGMIYQKKGVYQKAVEMYQKALMLEPQNIDALTSMASCQAGAGQANDAIISYEQVVMMDTNATEALRDLGDIYYKQNNKDAAVKDYKRYIVKVPGDQVVAKRLGMYCYEKKDYLSVIKYLAGLQYKSEADVEYAKIYADACDQTRQYKESIKVLEQLRDLKFKGTAGRTVLKALAEAFEKDSQDVKASEAYGAYVAIPGAADPDAAYKQAFLIEKTNPAAAKKIYEANTRLFVKDYRNFLRLGIMLAAKQETLQQAIPLLRKTAALAETVPQVWLELGKAYRQIGNDDEAYAAYQKYIHSDPQSAEANKWIGLLLDRKGKMTEALTYLEVANMLVPNDPDVLASMAKGYAQSNRKAEAIELLKKAKAAKSSDPDIRFMLSDLYRQTGDTKKSRDEVKELLTLKHDNKFLKLLVEVSITNGDYETAANTIEDILATDPENLDVLMLKSKVQMLQKKLDDAINTCKEIQNISPNYAPSLAFRANIHLMQSKVQWADVFFQRALKADPKYAPAELGLAKVAKLHKDMQSYQTHLQKAKDLDPKDPEVLAEIRTSGK